MNMITRIQPDAGTPSDNPTREEAEAAFRTIIRLRQSVAVRIVARPARSRPSPRRCA